MKTGRDQKMRESEDIENKIKTTTTKKKGNKVNGSNKLTKTTYYLK